MHACVWLFDCQLVALYHQTTSFLVPLTILIPFAVCYRHNLHFFLPRCCSRLLSSSMLRLFSPPLLPTSQLLTGIQIPLDLSLSSPPSSFLSPHSSFVSSSCYVSLSLPLFCLSVPPSVPLLFLHFPSPPSLCSPLLCTLYRELRPQVLPRPLPHPHPHQQQQQE